MEISDEEIRRLHKILNSSGERQFNEVEAKIRGLEILRLTLMAADPKGYAYNLEHPLPFPGLPIPPYSPPTPPTPQPFPIRLEADHAKEIESNLRMLADELRWVKRRPTAWRWALVALYNALGHTLAAHRPASFLPYTGIGQLTRLLDAVVGEHPELPQVRGSVEEIDRLRTTWITRGGTMWPIKLKKLPGIFLDCVRVVERLEPTPEAYSAQSKARLRALFSED